MENLAGERKKERSRDFFTAGVVYLIVILLILVAVFSGLYLSRNDDDGEGGEEEKDEYYRAIELGGEWFINNQDDSFLYYEYFPIDKDHSTTHHSLREMGALWAITKLATFLDDPRYDELALRGLEHFEEYFEYDQENDFLFVNVTPDRIKLGYSAFMILSLVEMEYPLKDYYLEQLAKSILYMQNEDGSFRTYFYSTQDTGVDYYPGEALVALMTLFDYTGNSAYIEAVEKAFPYYRDYWRNNKNTAFIPWHSRAYYDLYQHNGDREVADFIFEMNDYLLEQYFPDENCTNFAFLTSVVAVHMDGMNHAYLLAKQLEESERTECYSNFIQEGADFTLTLQITDTANIFDIEAVGGFMASKTSDDQRVDRNQHAVMALMDAYKMGLL